MKFRRNTVQRAAITLVLTISSGAPQIPLRADNSLERLPEPLKALTLTVRVHYKEKIQIKISQKKKRIELSPGKVPNAELPLSSPGGVMDSITFLALMCDSTYRMLPTRKAHVHLVPRGCLGLCHMGMVD